MLAEALAGLRRELAGAGVEISSTVNVDPEQPFGPWQAVLEAVRAGVATLDTTVAGTLLERSVPAADALQGVLPVAAAAAETSHRGAAFDAALAVAVDDAADLAARVAGDEPDLTLAVESAYAAVLAACYGTWVVRDVVDLATVATGIGLVDTALRPLDAYRRLVASNDAAAVLDVADAAPTQVWERLAEEARQRPDAEAMASVRLRSLAVVAGLGGAELVAVARLAPEGLELAVVADAALVIGDAALAAVSLSTGEVDPETCALARRAWEDGAAGW